MNGPSTSITLPNLSIDPEVIVILTAVPAVAVLLVCVVAVCRSQSAVHRARRGRAIIGLVLSWSVVSLLAFRTFLPQYSPHHSRRVDAQKTVTELRSAIHSYSSEYKRLPALPSATRDRFGDDLLDTRNHDLMDTLLGAPTATGTTHNRRQIQFFSARPAKMATARGLWKDPSSGQYHLLDPWGRPYFILIDANHDHTLNPPSRLIYLPSGRAYSMAIVWSHGKDGVAGGGDDIVAF